MGYAYRCYRVHREDFTRPLWVTAAPMPEDGASHQKGLSTALISLESFLRALFPSIIAKAYMDLPKQKKKKLKTTETLLCEELTDTDNLPTGDQPIDALRRKKHLLLFRLIAKNINFC